MKTTIAALAIAGALLTPAAAKAQNPQPGPVACAEDSPTFNWTRCGNKQRGLPIRHKHGIVLFHDRVSLKQCRKFHDQGRVVWSMAEPVRGDRRCKK